MLRDGLSGGQGGEVLLQALHGAVQARPERRGEAIGQAQAVGDEAQQADEDNFQAAGEFEPRLRLPRGDRGSLVGCGWV